MSAMTIRRALTTTRNGMPFAEPYRYQGTGRDVLTAFMDDEPDEAFGGGRAASEPCGTPAAYRRHLRRGEPVCADCRTGERERQRDRASRSYATHRDRGDGTPKCGVWNNSDPRLAGPGEDVTCTRCTSGGFR